MSKILILLRRNYAAFLSMDGIWQHAVAVAESENLLLLLISR